MGWTIKTKPSADKILLSLDKPVQKRIKKFIDERLATIINPRSIGEPLSGPLGAYWKYRVGDYRLIAQIKDNELQVLVIEIGHRKAIYQR